VLAQGLAEGYAAGRLDSVLEVDNLWVYYGGVAALRGVSLALAPHSITALIGANGAGKTTLLRTISVLNKPARGEIRFVGQRIDGLRPHKVVEIGIAHVPEGRRLFPEMTVIENLKMGGYARKDKNGVRVDLQRVFEHFPRLQERRDQRAGSMSGGEQQMLAMGRALMAKPRLLLLDEPSMGLAPIMVAEVAKIIRDINRELGVAILLVEQNARMALSLASQAYVLQTGTVFRQGEPQQLMHDEDLKTAYLGF
jgi:branched-chain amino acid transport system ATP-binding protein